MATFGLRVNDLPPEILGQILTHHIDDASSTHLQRGFATLSLVCRLWADLVNTTPTLWTRISFTHLARPNAEGRVSVARVLRHIEECLSHCKGLPVELEGNAFPEFYSPGSSSAFLAFMQDNSFRWRDLNLTEFFEMNMIWRIFAGADFPLESGGKSPISWPNLETINMQFSLSPYSPINCQFDMPKLRSVELTVSSSAALAIPRLACFPLHQLHRLSLTEFANPAKEWREALESCTSLRQLHLGLFSCYIAGSKSVDADERPMLVLPIRELRLTRIRRFEVLETILDNLSLPDLEELEIGFEGDRPLDVQEQNARSLDVVKDLIKRSNGCKRLSKLNLSHGKWGQEDVISLLALVPSLRELTLKEVDLPQTVLDVLGDTRNLPLLELLDLEVHRSGPLSPSNAQSLRHFLEKRGFGMSGNLTTSNWRTTLSRII